MPSLSIITINYNNCEGLQKTIQSVIAQTAKDYEYIIVDGGSTDGSKELIESYAGKLSYYISEKDKGIYHAMNKGIAAAGGTYLVFLNSGDFFLSRDVITSAEEMMSQEEADIYYGNIEMEDAKGNNYIQTYLPKLSLQFWENGTINHQASFIRASLFNELGVYDIQFSLAADYAFFLKAFACGKKYCYLNLDMVHYRLDGRSISKKDQYLSQQNKIWQSIIPGYAAELYAQNKAYKSLMQHRIMLLAKGVNKKYISFRHLLKGRT